jgi:hypothetical protein
LQKVADYLLVVRHIDFDRQRLLRRSAPRKDAPLCHCERVSRSPERSEGEALSLSPRILTCQNFCGYLLDSLSLTPNLPGCVNSNMSGMPLEGQ